jgi:hypothetical protein
MVAARARALCRFALDFVPRLLVRLCSFHTAGCSKGTELRTRGGWLGRGDGRGSVESVDKGHHRGREGGREGKRGKGNGEYRLGLELVAAVPEEVSRVFALVAVI